MVSLAKENNVSKLLPKRYIIMKIMQKCLAFGKISAKVLKFYHSVMAKDLKGLFPTL